MNVMISDISEDLNTTVKGVQTTITLFLLIMAVLMIPCSKLTDRWGRKRCFTMGLTLYGIGALVSAASPNLGVLILGNSVFEGVGTALLIPPVYILATLWFADVTSRAWAFGVISGLGGVGAAAGPLIGGLITTGISWRAAFVFQALVIATILLLSRRLVDPLPAVRRAFDAVGAIPLCGQDVLRCVRDPAGRIEQRPLCDLSRDRSSVPGFVLPLHPAPGARRKRAASLDKTLSEPDL
jgi:MFS family permease